MPELCGSTRPSGGQYPVGLRGKVHRSELHHAVHPGRIEGVRRGHLDHRARQEGVARSGQAERRGARYDVPERQRPAPHPRRHHHAAGRGCSGNREEAPQALGNRETGRVEQRLGGRAPVGGDRPKDQRCVVGRAMAGVDHLVSVARHRETAARIEHARVAAVEVRGDESGDVVLPYLHHHTVAHDAQRIARVAAERDPAFAQVDPHGGARSVDRSHIGVPHPEAATRARREEVDASAIGREVQSIAVAALGNCG